MVLRRIYASQGVGMVKDDRGTSWTRPVGDGKRLRLSLAWVPTRPVAHWRGKDPETRVTGNCKPEIIMTGSPECAVKHVGLELHERPQFVYTSPGSLSHSSREPVLRQLVDS